MPDLTDHERILQLEWEVKAIDKLHKAHAKTQKYIITSIIIIAAAFIAIIPFIITK